MWEAEGKPENTFPLWVLLQAACLNSWKSKANQPFLIHIDFGHSVLSHKQQKKSSICFVTFLMFHTMFFYLIYPILLSCTLPWSTLSFLIHVTFCPFYMCISLMSSFSSLQLMLPQSLGGIPQMTENQYKYCLFNRVAVKWDKTWKTRKGRVSSRKQRYSERSTERLWNGDLNCLSRTITPNR